MPDKIDEFESLFKSADKPTLRYQPPTLKTVVVVTDTGRDETDRLLAAVRKFLRVIDGDDTSWFAVGGGDYKTVAGLVERVSARDPGLIVTYRHLHDSDREPTFSLGAYLEELIKKMPMAVLVLPGDTDAAHYALGAHTSSVMVVTDHITGQGRLVSCAAALTEPGGTLTLVHIEDDATLQRYVNAISKIPAIETDLAEANLRQQLLKEPGDYITSCEEVLRRAGVNIELKRAVELGHTLTDYRRLIAEHRVDLLVMNAETEDQRSMMDKTHVMTSEFREVPLLLL